MTEEQFTDAIRDALDALPDDFLAILERDNVAVIYREWPTLDEVRDCGTLPLAYYRRTGPMSGAQLGLQLNTAPVIMVFHGFFEAAPYRDDYGQVRDAVRRTLIHEIAHHFNISHERMKELGYA